MKYIAVIFLLLTFIQVQAKSFLPSSFKARFTQEYVSSLRREKRTSQGVIHYQYPGHIRFSVEGKQQNKQKIAFVSNSKRSWYYTAPFIKGEPGELITSGGSAGQKQNPYARLFDILRQGLVDNRYYKVSKKSKKSASTLTFTQAGVGATQIKSATIFFKGKKRFDKIGRIELVFADGKDFALNLSSIETNVKFKKGHFVFVPPPNTRQL